MLQVERHADLQEALRIAFDSLAASMYCARVGIVESYDPISGTVKVNLAIQAVATDSTGKQTNVTIRPLVDVPVCYQGGGGMVTTFPIAAGDEALVVFADRCIDGWFQSGGVQPQADPRIHDISDGFAFVGPRSLARKLSNVSTSTAQFRSIDGTTYFEIAQGQQANVVAPGGVTITGPVTIKGNVSVQGTVTATGEGTFSQIPVSSHIHGGVAAGGSDTAPPTA